MIPFALSANDSGVYVWYSYLKHAGTVFTASASVDGAILHSYVVLKSDWTDDEFFGALANAIGRVLYVLKVRKAVRP